MKGTWVTGSPEGYLKHVMHRTEIGWKTLRFDTSGIQPPAAVRSSYLRRDGKVKLFLDTIVCSTLTLSIIVITSNSY